MNQVITVFIIISISILPFLWKIASQKTEYEEQERKKEKLRQQKIDELLGV